MEPGSLQSGCVFFRDNQVLSSFFGDPTPLRWWVQDFWGERNPSDLPVRRSSPRDFANMAKSYLETLGNLNTSHYQWHLPEAASYSRVFSQANDRLKNHGLQKTVPLVQSWREGIPNLATILLWILRGLESCQNQWLYAHWGPDAGIVGVTPELLFDQKRDRILTMALAGTRPEARASELLLDPKELYEHQVVVQDIVSILREVGDIDRQTIRTVRANGLAHLLTPIELRIAKPVSTAQLVRLLHPTPALGCFPRQHLSFLRELDCLSLGRPRRFFGSPFGWYENDKAELIVSIRGIEWYENKTRIITGSGVVAQSTEESEWRELLLKQERIRTFWMEPHVESAVV